MANRSLLSNPIYDEIGVRTIIQASGTKTAYSGPRLEQEVIDAMKEAARSSVDMVELNKKVGEYISKVTHAEAGMVTSGAASGIILSSAACMTGLDRAKMKRLPDGTGMKNEIIMQKIHRGHYSHLYRYSGARIIETGDLVSSTAEEVEYAINENTAAINFLIGPKIYEVGVSLENMSKIARKHGIPLIVDAAAMLPPKENLWKYIEAGADLVTFSGGKVIKGPQNSGLLAGKKELIDAAILNCSPYNMIGRAHKVSKEDIVGFYVALKKFMSLNEDLLYEECRSKINRMMTILSSQKPGISCYTEHDFHEFSVPVLLIKSSLFDVEELIGLLKAGDPPIYMEYHKTIKGLVVNPFALEEDEPELVAEVLCKLFSNRMQQIK